MSETSQNSAEEVLRAFQEGYAEGKQAVRDAHSAQIRDVAKRVADVSLTMGEVALEVGLAFGGVDADFTSSEG